MTLGAPTHRTAGPPTATMPRAAENQSATSPTLLLFVVLALLGVLAYPFFSFTFAFIVVHR